MELAREQKILDQLRAPIESYLLAEFVDPQTTHTILDVGCGSGFIALSLANRFPQCPPILGMDIEQDHIKNALICKEKLSQIKEIASVEFVVGDVRSCPLREYKIGHIISNPPFFISREGRVAGDKKRRVARSDVAMNLEDLFTAAQQLLCREGFLSFVLPANRFQEVLPRVRNLFSRQIARQEWPDIRRKSGGVVCATYQL